MQGEGSILVFFDSILKKAIVAGASDVHIKCCSSPFFRIHGILSKFDLTPIQRDEILDFIKETLPVFGSQKWGQELQVDYNYFLARNGESEDDKEMGGYRFRVTCFYQRGAPGLVFRLIKGSPPNFDDLLLNSNLLKKLCHYQDGIVLVCGPTGAGKTTTLAAMINYIGSNFKKHIVTLEDPIEYTYEDVLGVVTQHEVGTDTRSFSEGLRGALRQDPDVIVVGEMRDAATFETALTAAETGHLVLTSLHASDSRQAIERLVDFFPKTEQLRRWRQVASSVRAVVIQHLLPKFDMKGRRPAMEVFIVEGLAEKIVAKGEFDKIDAIIESDQNIGSLPLNMDLYNMVKEKSVRQEDALAISNNPRALEMRLRGITFSHDQLLG